MKEFILMREMLAIFKQINQHQNQSKDPSKDMRCDEFKNQPTRYIHDLFDPISQISKYILIYRCLT